MIFVKYIGNEQSLYNLKELKETIFKVVQFTSKDGQFGTKTYAITIPFCDKDWKSFERNRYVQYDNVDHKKIYTFDVDQLELVHESEIPESFQRDFKLDYLLSK